MQNRLANLARTIGSECAQREVKWMKQSKPTDLLEMLDRRLQGEPLQYILGTTPFGPLDLLTRPPTLIPRPETEDWALRLARIRTPSVARPVRVLDLCTGSGCIPLLLCHLWPPGSTRAVGVDISSDAIRLAADNTTRSRARPGTLSSAAAHLRTAPAPQHNDDEDDDNKTGLRPDLIDAGCENVFTPLLGDIHDPSLLHRLDPQPPFDVITANPPYIPLPVYRTLPSSVKDYEDPRALIGDLPDDPHQDGLSFYRSIAALLAREGVLGEDAVVALEVGDGQAHAVKRILRHTPGLQLGQIDIWKDPWDKERVVFARVAQTLDYSGSVRPIT